MAVDFPWVLGAAPHGRDADAAPHQQIAALRLHGKAVARQAQHIQTVAHRAAGQPVSALAPDLEYDGHKVIGLIRVAGTHGDRPAQQQALPTLHMNKLSRRSEGGADHVPRLQHHIYRVSHLFLGDDLTLAFYFHDRSPLSFGSVRAEPSQTAPGIAHFSQGTFFFCQGNLNH